MEKLKEIFKNPYDYNFLAIIILYFLTLTINGGSTNPQTLVEFGAFFPPYILQYKEYYRFLTSIFIHIGLSHLLFNGYALYAFGHQIESLMGSLKYSLFFLLTGIFGNLATFIFNFESLSAGASGSLFGILGAFLYLIRHHGNMISQRGKSDILQLVAINLLITFLVPSISVTAHLGGLVSGYLLSFIFIK